MGERSDVLKAVVVGCGVGKHHARSMAGLDDFDLVALCDLDEARAREAAEKLDGVAVYADFERALDAERPDVVAVATPNDSHARLTIMAAEAGVRGICCEKPMATCMGDARAMVAACREHNIPLIVHHQRRMGTDLVAMRRLMEEGAIGEPYLIRTANGGDILSDGTHAVDSIRHLAGDEDVKWVFGQVYRDLPEGSEAQGGGYHASGGFRFGHPIETGGFGVIEFATGLRAEMLTGKLAFPGRAYQDYEVFGTEGALWRRGDRGDPAVLLRDGQADGWRPAPLGDGGERRHSGSRVYRLFAEMIRDGAEHPLNGDSALKDHEVVMAVYESARLHRRLDMPLEQDRFPLGLMIEAGQL